MRVANLAVATSESWRDRVSGERKERTEWHRLRIKPKRALAGSAFWLVTLMMSGR